MARFYCDIERARPVTRHGRRRLDAVPVTWALILANLAVFAADYFSPGTGSLYSVGQWAEFDPAAVWGGEWWRLLTHAFVHNGAGYLGSNLVALLIIGYNVEPVIGKSRFLAAYLALAVFPSLVGLIVDPATSFGASAALFGIAGIYLALLWRGWKPWAPTERWIWTLVVLWSLWSTWGEPDVGYLAHLVGLVTGAWYGCTLPIRRWDPRRVMRNLRLRHATLVTSFLLAGILAMGAFWQPDWWYARANRAAENGDWTTAQRHLRILERCVIPTVENDAIVLLRAADLFQEHDDPIHALALVEKAVPTLDSPLAHVVLGNFQIALDPPREREALDNYLEALSRDPECGHALIAAAELELTATDSTVYDPVDARRLAKRAVRLTRGQDPDDLQVLADAQFECGNTDEAIRLLEKALRLDPEDPEFYENRLSEIRATASDSLSGIPEAGSQTSLPPRPA